MRQSPTVRRRRLTRELRRMREAAGLSAEDARHQLGWTSGRLNHIESGRSRPDPSALRDLMNLYGVTDEDRRKAILELGRQSKEKGWWASFGDVLPDDFIGFEAEASEILTFQPIVIPGLLQTPDYAAYCARANLARAETEIERIVTVRQKRQQILASSDPPELHAIIDEGALIRLCRSDTKLANQQISYLIDVAEALNTVSIQIHAQDAGMYAAISGAFTILDYTDELDLPIVYLGTMDSGLYLETPPQISAYRKVFDHVSMDALSKAGSIELMKRMIT